MLKYSTLKANWQLFPMVQRDLKFKIFVKLRGEGAQ